MPAAPPHPHTHPHACAPTSSLDALDSDMAEVRAASMLHGLGFDKEMQVGAAPACSWLSCVNALVCSLSASFRPSCLQLLRSAALPSASVPLLEGCSRSSRLVASALLVVTARL